MEQYIKNLNDDDEDEKTELNKKLLNYRTEYFEILNRYKEIQDNYISRKTENALMEDQNVSNLVDDEEKKNRVSVVGTAIGAGDPYVVDGELKDSPKKSKKESDNNDSLNKFKNNINNYKNQNQIAINNTTNNSILEHDNSNIIGYTLDANKEKEEAFHQINRDYDIKKKRAIIICVLICILIFFIIILIAILSS